MRTASTFFKFAKVLLLCIALSGCVPGLRVGIVRQHKLEDVELDITSRGNNREKIEFLLRNQIERYIVHAASNLDEEIDLNNQIRYKLSIEYETYEETYAVQTNSIAKRQKAGLKVWYTLVELPEKTLVSDGYVNRSGSFDIEDSTYSTHVARVQEWENLIYPIVDEILLNISIDLN